MSNLQDLLGDEQNERDNPSTDYPSWLNAEGRALYDTDLSFRINCQQCNQYAEWREKLNKEAERVYNQ